ncbi:cysteine proteinases superfamily protein isoform X1 [Wolffia australiana]
MGFPKPNDKVLSFGDVVLRNSDLEILRGPHYINDRIIEFCFADISINLSDDIVLVPPSISFWIANCAGHDSLEDAINPLELPGKNLVIFTVNDNDDVGMAEGGHHWSLLVYDREENLFVHHDSMKGMNHAHAKQLYERVKEFVGSAGNSVRFLEGETPRQENGYDCGLFAVEIARVVCQWRGRRAVRCGGRMWFDDVMAQVDGKVVGETRARILSRIDRLRLSG